MALEQGFGLPPQHLVKHTEALPKPHVLKEVWYLLLCLQFSPTKALKLTGILIALFSY